jgi:hypothetical protein
VFRYPVASNSRQGGGRENEPPGSVAHLLDSATGAPQIKSPRARQYGIKQEVSAKERSGEVLHEHFVILDAVNNDLAG